MTVLTQANKMFLGTQVVNRVYTGATKIYQGAAPTGPAGSILLSYTPGTDRNDFTGEVGVRIGIGAASLPVNWVGYRCNTGNSGLRTVYLVDWMTGITERTVTIDLTGKTAGEYVWAEMTTFTLLANSYYAIMTPVTAGGQAWKNPGPVTMIPAITNIYDVYKSGGFQTGLQNSSFVGLDLGWT